jgi:GMP synthase-like glutamine amidotransferase
MRVVVIRHHDIDSAGFIAEAFGAQGAQLHVHLVPDDGPFPHLDGVDHIVVLGAANSVNDQGPASVWIAAELAWLRRADQSGVPILGICFGAQALCAAFGGRVEAMERHEVGWRLTELTEDSPIEPGPWLEFHGDRCLLPPQAQVLANTDLAVQAFQIGPHLGVQFHPEVDGPQLKRWLDALGSRDAEEAGVDPDQFLTDTIREEPAARARAGRLVATALELSR